MHIIKTFPTDELQALLTRYGMSYQLVKSKTAIPGSFWGDEEAGLIGDTLFVRDDTPLHSALHETCHYICMSKQRREQLHTDAGGTDIEESAVCYLQNLLAEQMPSFGIQASFTDMDAWGYSFRLGSTKAWFSRDADDAKEWLLVHQLIRTKPAQTKQALSKPAQINSNQIKQARATSDCFCEYEPTWRCRA